MPSLLRRHALLGGTAFAPYCLAACTGVGQETTRPTALRPDVAVNVQVNIAAANQSSFEGVARAWQQAHPQGPKLEWSVTVGDAYTKLQTDLAAGTAPDIVQLDPKLAITLAARGQLLALDTYVRRDRYDLGDFFELGINQYRWKGQLYGLPRGMSNQVIFYNQTLFDQAGVGYPPSKGSATGWDFDGFLKAADTLTKRSGDATTQWGFSVGRAYRGGWGQWVLTNGGEVFDKDFRRCLLGEPRAVEALQFMQDLMYKYRVAPTPKEDANPQPTFINNGTIAMRISPAAGIAEHRRAAFPWDNAVTPQGKGKRVTTGGGVGWLPVAGTTDLEETWAVFAHLGGAEAATSMATVWYPARRSALTWLLAQDPGLPPKSRHVGADGQEIMAPDPIFPGWDEIEREILGPEMAPLWNNGKSARQWADSVVPKVNAALQAQAR